MGSVYICRLKNLRSASAAFVPQFVCFSCSRFALVVTLDVANWHFVTSELWPHFLFKVKFTYKILTLEGYIRTKNQPPSTSSSDWHSRARAPSHYSRFKYGSHCKKKHASWSDIIMSHCIAKDHCYFSWYFFAIKSLNIVKYRYWKLTFWGETPVEFSALCYRIRSCSFVRSTRNQPFQYLENRLT